jgi:hypothetical protein
VLNGLRRFYYGGGRAGMKNEGVKRAGERYAAEKYIRRRRYQSAFKTA